MGGAVEFDRVVPPRGTCGSLAGSSGWPGPFRQLVRFWADCELIHLFIGGARIKTVRSHLTVTDLASLVATAPSPPALPRCHRSSPEGIEVERVVSRGGTVCLGRQVLLAAEILGGQRSGSGSSPPR